MTSILTYIWGIPILAALLLPVTRHLDEALSYCKVTDVLLGIGKSAAVPVMIRWLNSPDKKEAATAAEVLGDIGGDLATAALTRSLGDTDPGVRPSNRQYIAYAVSWEQIPDDGLPRYDAGRPR